MEVKPRHLNNGNDVARTLRNIPPAHYSLKIGSFSLLSRMLSDADMQNYESDIFEASGYKWKLSLYPNGDKERNGEGYISLYLVIAETSNLPLGWEVNVNYKLFVFDQIQDKYMTFQEVFVINYSGRGESLTLMKGLDTTFTWTIQKFSSLQSRYHYSDTFSIGNRKWNLLLYPKGDDRQKDKFLSLFLVSNDCKTLPSERKTYATYRLRIRNQYRLKSAEITGTKFFSVTGRCWGYSSFLSLKDLRDASKGFLVNDTLIVQAEVSAISTVKNFSK
ncbi:ubiquitin C-terminal hydrolase 13-like isoform X3 [Actinidia eriantha]|uniref:ubiquitin C-terminal hydrolase 13-like isoform X3 n=1 Tax=Actinidia eriantha TaxID=165200 RepID=UPI002587ED02|nr:ubiquitin C-terminal hydrolase 13-like isoform X3 [Actinidia eriantha]